MVEAVNQADLGSWAPALAEGGKWTSSGISFHSSEVYNGLVFDSRVLVRYHSNVRRVLELGFVEIQNGNALLPERIGRVQVGRPYIFRDGDFEISLRAFFKSGGLHLLVNGILAENICTAEDIDIHLPHRVFSPQADL